MGHNHTREGREGEDVAERACPHHTTRTTGPDGPCATVEPRAGPGPAQLFTRAGGPACVPPPPDVTVPSCTVGEPARLTGAVKIWRT